METKSVGLTYAQFIRGMVAKGKTEPQIWAAMRRKFGLTDESKRRYIGWYLPKEDKPANDRRSKGSARGGVRRRA